MPLFQTSVLNKYLQLQNKAVVNKAYKIFSNYFHNSKIQQNIRESKEEQFQEGFLRALFVNVLDYTLNPKPDFNLTTELKNEKGAKKADGAILKEGKALAVIELKGTKTKDLEKIRQQAFDYKNNQSACVYVITSNFEKIRFYINNAVDFEEFNLFTLTFQQFELLYLCLHKDNILNNLPAKLKKDSLVEEEQITKRFYADYSLFKRELFRDLVKENVKNEVFRTELLNNDADKAQKKIKLTLFKKSQKLIDRFLFIFFAEDRGLLPPNSTLKIIDDWNEITKRGVRIPLYDIFKNNFIYLDKGRKGTSDNAEIFAYNGGLFKPDSILDSLLIDDKLLLKHTKILSEYDFESQVDVNILGHIFENSLNEIESINAEIEGAEFDKQKTKRKKDGVFYTPKYITKYIVDNTVGKLCTEKKNEFDIIDDEYFKSRKGRPVKTLKTLEEKLKTYREWLLTITILDPACGSGAFLNQALDFLIKEHRYIDELLTSLTGGAMVLPTNPNTILENNIFGVDLNEESVEIAKLSLWLRTAEPRRKLNTLSGNIKCGNSLISSKSIAGYKAFDWHKEFPQVFNSHAYAEEKTKTVIPDQKPDYIKLVKEKSKEAKQKVKEAAELSRQALEISNQVYAYAEKMEEVSEPEVAYNVKPKNKTASGFDVVIGNPPYVRHELLSKIKPFLKKKYLCYNSTADLYTYFFEKGMDILKENGLLAYILPNKFINSKYGENLRTYLLKFQINKIIDFGELPVFEEASTFPAIFILKKKRRELSTKYIKITKLNKNGFDEELEKEKLIIEIKNKEWKFFSSEENIVLEKIKLNTVTLNDYVNGEIKFGIKTGFNEAYIISNEKKEELIKEDPKVSNLIYPFIDGNDVRKYRNEFNNKYIIAAKFGQNLEEYPSIIKHFSKYKNNLEKRSDKGKKWYQLRTCSYYHSFEQTKIFYPDIALEPRFSYDETGMYPNATLFVIPKADKFLLAILNSKLAWFFFARNCPVIGDINKRGRLRLKTIYISKLPIKEISADAQQAFIKKADQMLALNKELQKESSNFISTLKEEKGVVKITKKFSTFSDFQYDEFKKELRKQKIKINLGEENNEWREYFNTSKQKVNTLQNKIKQTDKEIDKMVYALYGLSGEDIKIVENN